MLLKVKFLLFILEETVELLSGLQKKLFTKLFLENLYLNKNKAKNIRVTQRKERLNLNLAISSFLLQKKVSFADL